MQKKSKRNITKLPSSRTVFKRPAALIRNARYNSALFELYDTKTGIVKRKYIYDLNRAYFLIGLSWQRLNKFRISLKFFLKAIHYNRNDYLSYSYAAYSFSEIGFTKIAFRYYSKAFEIGGSNVDAYNAGNMLFDLRDYRAAIDMYQICKDDPDIPECHRNLDLAIKIATSK